MEVNVEASNLESGADERLRFACNVCGTSCAAMPAELDREVPSCASCGSTVRIRSLVTALTTWATGASRVLSDLPKLGRRGMGLSDWDPLAAALTRVFDYTNTFFDTNPRLDITQPPLDQSGSVEFLISSDVFEHVAPPVQRAFDGAFTLVRPGGLLVLTVPYVADAPTVEHFPTLHDFTIAQLASGPILVNRTAAGALEVHEDLVFHGGPGQTLEMRVFGLANVIDALTRAGFMEPSILPEDPAHGVIWRSPHSRTITAMKPAADHRRPRLFSLRRVAKQDERSVPARSA